MEVDIENSRVGVGAEDSTIPSGAGFLISDSNVLTCAHVVNASLGRALDSQATPDKSVRLFFLADPNGPLIKAAVQNKDHWRPPGLPMPDGESADIAILTLSQPAPTMATKAPLRYRKTLNGKEFSVFGFPENWDFGQSQPGMIGASDLLGRFELRPNSNLPDFIRPGFSGAPVVYESPATKRASVLGMVVSARKDAQDKTAYMIPVQHLRRAISGLPNIDLRNGVVDDFDHIALVEDHLQSAVFEKRNKRQFNLRIVRVKDGREIAQLFRNDPPSSYDAESATPERTVRDGKLSMLLIQSPGGAGKSNFSADVVKAAIELGMVPFWMEATRLNVTDSASSPLQTVLSCSVGGGLPDFSRARDEVGPSQIILLADRLNENPASGNALLQAIVKTVVSEASGIRVLIADRVIDRGINIAPLKLATIMPLSTEEVARHLDATPKGTNAKLLAVPFFLEMQLRVGEPDQKGHSLTRSQMFREFFRVYAGADDQLLRNLAKSAFTAYKDCKSTVIPSSVWRNMLQIPESAKQKFVEGAMLEYTVESGSEKMLEFRHQLLQDFLAGTYLCSNEKLWRAPDFDVATLEGQSSDALELAAEQLGGHADDFLIKVYDWSWVAVLECVKNLNAGRHGGKSPVSDEFKDALYSLNALRLFDQFGDTQERTRQIIAELRPSGWELETAADFGGLREKVRQSYNPAKRYYEDWKGLFLHDDKTPLTVADLSYLWQDPFVSWTATSIFRWLPLTAEVQNSLHMSYGLAGHAGGNRPEAVGIRWRIVHLLGVLPNANNRAFLWSVTRDAGEDKWVRLGAVRSYIETALRLDSRNTRQQMFHDAANWIRETAELPDRVAHELRHTAKPAQDVPEGWYTDYLEILEAGIWYSHSRDDAEQEQEWTKRRDEIQVLAAKKSP